MSKELIAWLRHHCLDERGDEAADTIERLERELAELISALELTQPGSEFAQCLPDNWSLAAAKAYEQMQTILFKWRKP